MEETETTDETPDENVRGDEAGTFTPAYSVDTLYTIMSQILANKERLKVDNRKIANVDQKEMGQIAVTVRGGLNLANIAEFYGLKELGAFWRAEVDDILATSLSKEGFADLVMITQKRESLMGATKKKGWRR